MSKVPKRVQRSRAKPTFDRHGYPTEDTCDKIKNWNPLDPVGLFKFVKAAWSDTGCIREPEDNVIELITGGWSGNEELIGALQSNVAWPLCWQMSQRGGMHRFEIPENFRKEPSDD